MATFIKQSTAITIELGPFVDSTDGDTEETALSLVAADILISKNHAALAAKGDATNPTGGTNGHYQVTINATDTGTLGRLRVYAHKTGALPVWEDFEVVPANVYDSLVAGTDTLQSDVTQLGGVAQSLTDLKDFADAGYDPSTNKVQGVLLVDTTTTNTDMRGTDGAALATGVQLNAQGKLDVNAEADQALLDAGATVTRHGYLDNLNVGGLVASSAEATAIQNNTRAVRVVPPAMERPDTGSIAYTLDLYLYDTLNNMEAPDALPTVTARNHAGVTRVANLSAVTLVAIGHYQVTYTVASTHAKEALTIEWSVVEGGNTRLYGSGTMVVDDAASTFTAGDRTKLDTLHDVRLTAPRATNLDNLDLAVSTRNAFKPLIDQEVRDAMKLSPTVGAPASGSVDEHLDNIPTTGTDGDIVRGGTAQGGSVSTITLDAGASAINGNYDNDLVVITGGTGAGQSESVSSYLGATKVATMAANWKTAPDNTSVFSVYGRGTVAGATAPTTAQIADAVLDELMSGHDVAGSLAAAIRDVVERIAGNIELDRTTHKLVIKNAADATTRYTLQTREKPTDANVQEVVRT